MLRPLLVSLIALATLSLPQEGHSQQSTNNSPTSPDVDRLWAALADADAAKAFQSITTLVRTPGRTVALLGSRLKPATAPEPRQVEQWIGDLNSPRFAVRERAGRKLDELGGLAESPMRKALQSSLPLEVRRRLEKLVDKLSGPLTLPEHLRAVRAVEVLERIGTPEAKKLLRAYAAGAPGSRLTRDSSEALQRPDKAASDGAREPKAENHPFVDLYGDPLPAGAVGRLGTIRFRRDSNGLTELAFLPDGKTILTASQGHEVQLWDAASGRLVREIRVGPLSIAAFALAPDAKHFAIAGAYPYVAQNVAPAGELRVYSLSSGKVVQTLARESRDVYHSHLAFSPDGKLLFSLGSKGILRIEDVVSGKEVLQRQFRPDNSPQMVLSPDGKHLALTTGLNTHEFYLWEWQVKEPRKLEVPWYGVYWLSYSPDGKLLATVGYTSEQGLRVWDVAGGRVLYQHDCLETGYSYWGKPVFTPDGKTLVVPLRSHRGTGDGKTELFDPRTGARQGLLATSSSTMSISADSRRLAVAAGQGVRVWDLATRKELGPACVGHTSDPTHIVVSTKGLIVTTGNDNTVRLWDAATTRQKRKFTVDGWVRAIALSPDANLLAASSFDDRVHVWNPHTGREIYRLAGHGELGGHRTLRFLPDGKGLLSWGDDFYLRLWNMKTGKAQFEHAIRPAGVTIPESDGDDRRSGKEDFMIRLGNGLITPDARSFVLDIAGQFRTFDIKTGKETVKFASSESMSNQTAVSPDGKGLLLSAWGSYQIKNHPVFLMDASSGRVRQRLILPSSVGGPVAFSPDGRAFATSIDEPDGQILIYEVASGKVRHTIRGYRGRVGSLAFLPGGDRLVSGHGDSTLLIWDLTSKGS
jgi:WD40 repeat protein